MQADPNRCGDCPHWNEWRQRGVLPCCRDVMEPDAHPAYVPPRPLVGGAQEPVPA